MPACVSTPPVMTRASSTMVAIAVPFMVEGWHAPAGRRTREPRPLPRPGRSDRHRRWMPGLGPGRQAAGKTARAASAESEVRPGPRPRHYAQATAKPRKPERVGAPLIIPADMYGLWLNGDHGPGRSDGDILG